MPIPYPPARLVLFVAFPRMGLLDLTAPQTAFWAASEYMQKRGLQGYSRHTVSLHGGLVQSIEGVGLDTVPFSDFDGCEIDTIVVPGAPDIERELAIAGETVEWVRQASQRARRISSVCTGAFLLAQAGLLENKRAATHWTMCDRLQQLFPTLEVDSKAIFVQQGAIWTSAGVSSGIDLALAMIEADCGRDVAMYIAKELVVFLKRPGSQAQHSELLQAQSKDTDTFDELHLWLSDNLGMVDLGVTDLAERVRMSPRNFARVYKQKTGRPPGKAIELFRLEAAQRLLENSNRNLDQIALQCGFADEGRMRVMFQRNLGVSPSDYRKRFATT
jgi:transcriptional regulator GlxA family with amidase domain